MSNEQDWEPKKQFVEPPTAGKNATSPRQPSFKDEAGKKHSTFMAAVRARGILNRMLDGPVQAFERGNPGWRARWEYCPPSGDKTFVVAREGMGFRIVDARELGEEFMTPSGQREGQVKIGDLILMAGPEDLVNEIEEEDARMAYEDFKLPEEAYRQHIRGIKAKLRDGSEKETEAVGEIRQTQEVISPPTGSLGMGHEAAE